MFSYLQLGIMLLLPAPACHFGWHSWSAVPAGARFMLSTAGRSLCRGTGCQHQQPSTPIAVEVCRKFIADVTEAETCMEHRTWS